MWPLVLFGLLGVWMWSRMDEQERGEFWEKTKASMKANVKNSWEEIQLRQKLKAQGMSEADIDRLFQEAARRADDDDL